MLRLTELKDGLQIAASSYVGRVQFGQSANYGAPQAQDVVARAVAALCTWLTKAQHI